VTPEPVTRVYQVFHGRTLATRPRLDDDSLRGQCASCAHNRRDLSCVIFERGIPALFSLGRLPCPDRVEGP